MYAVSLLACDLGLGFCMIFRGMECNVLIVGVFVDFNSDKLCSSKIEISNWLILHPPSVNAACFGIDLNLSSACCVIFYYF